MSAAFAHLRDVELRYETFGDRDDEAIVLLMGVGMQMTAWDPAFCKALAAKRFFVIRFDNRDIGLSAETALAYTLSDLADDAIGLLDSLGVHAAHFVGASMGAMVAQLAAIEHRDRVLSLTSMMGSTGDPTVGQPHLEVLTAGEDLDEGRDATIERMMRLQRIIGSPGYPLSERQLRAFAERSYDRAHRPGGASRQLAAVLSAPDRTAALRQLDVPALVIHGREDVLVDPSGGEATAEAIPAAELIIFDGMGHDLPAPLWPRFIEAIVGVARRAESRR